VGREGASGTAVQPTDNAKEWGAKRAASRRRTDY
jgi:hypothetical protein